jgi:hypothetical protein
VIGLRLTWAINAVLIALVSSGFIARLDFGELARWGRKDQGRGTREEGRENPLRCRLTLALLVLGVFADDADDTLAMDDLALVADRFYRCTDLHWYFPSVAHLRG